MSQLLRAREMLWGDEEPTLSFDAWRALAPRLAGRESDEREQILNDAKVSVADWERADGYWSITLAAECARGDRARAEAFGQACSEDLRARPQTPAEAPNLPLLVEGTSAEEELGTRGESGDPGAMVEPPVRVEPPDLAIPSFLRTDAPAPGRTHLRSGAAEEGSGAKAASGPLAPEVAERATMALSPFSGASRPALPFGSASKDAPALARVAPVARPAQSGATLDLTGRLVPAPPAPAPFSGLRREAPRNHGDTMMLDPDVLARMLAGKGPRDGKP